MSFGSCVFRFLKKLGLFIVILAIAVPLRYGSTNPQYLTFRLLHSILSIKNSFISDRVRPTLSPEYRAFEDILRMKPIPKSNFDEDALTIVKRMRSATAISNIIPKPKECQVNKEVFEHDGHQVDTYWVENHQKKFQRHADHIILYFHGGGYILGDIENYSGIECYYSQLFNITILHVEYRLVPEHAFPGAVTDGLAIYRALLHQGISSSQLFIMGDSAGGGLSLLIVQAIINHKLPVPRGIIVLSPWTDLTASGESHVRNRAIDVMVSPDNNEWILKQLLGDNQAKLTSDSAILSPLFGSFEGFPPMYINVGTAEILEDDAKRVYKKAKDAGVSVTLEEGVHLMHVYPMFFSFFPEARHTLNNINKWISTLTNHN